MKRLLQSGFSLVLFILAIWIIRHELQRYPLREILAEFRNLKLSQLMLSTGLTAICYWILTGYDLLAFKYFKVEISYSKVTFAAFIAYAFSNTIGMANFAGAAIRYRIYSKWRIPDKTIAAVITLDILSNWLGFLVVIGLAFTLIAPPIPSEAHLPIHDARPLGIVCLLLLASYILFTWIKKKPLCLGKLEFPVPKSGIFFSQVAVACLDFILGGVVLASLLPLHSDLTMIYFLGIYLLAQTAGVLSHVPGGLGVFETIMLLSLSRFFSGPQILGALVIYRAIYYLIPFGVAVVLLAAFELRTRPRT